MCSSSSFILSSSFFFLLSSGIRSSSHFNSSIEKIFSIAFLTKHVPTTIMGNTTEMDFTAFIAHNTARHKICNNVNKWTRFVFTWRRYVKSGWYFVGINKIKILSVNWKKRKNKILLHFLTHKWLVLNTTILTPSYSWTDFKLYLIYQCYRKWLKLVSFFSFQIYEMGQLFQLSNIWLGRLFQLSNKWNESPFSDFKYMKWVSFFRFQIYELSRLFQI